MNYVHRTISTPVGTLMLVANQNGLAAVCWENDRRVRTVFAESLASDNNAFLLEAERQLKEYFAGTRQTFSIDLDFEGTEFQKRVWNALLEIPYGETRSYADIARRVGNPKAMRAVGSANGKNPIPIIAPCHRVIGASGALTGFGGGLETKAKLLDLERRVQFANLCSSAV